MVVAPVAALVRFGFAAMAQSSTTSRIRLLIRPLDS